MATLPELNMEQAPADQPLRLVLDTNVVLDLLHYRDAGVAGLHGAILQGALQVVTSAACLEELRRVLAYPEFGLDEAAAAAIFRAFAEMTESVAVPDADAPDLPCCRDPDDQKFLRLAHRAQAAFLLTRDKALLRLARAAMRRTRFAIVTPAAFCEVFQSSTARRLGSASLASGAASSMDQTTLR